MLRWSISLRRVLGSEAPGQAVADGGTLWLTEPGHPSGQLLRVNLATGGVTGRVAIAGDPEGIDAAQGRVWIAGGAGDGTERLEGEDTLTEISETTLAVLGVYRVLGARAVAAEPQGALSISQASANGPTLISSVGSSQSFEPVGESGLLAYGYGDGSAVATCNGATYVALEGASGVQIVGLPGQGHSAETLLTTRLSGYVSLACDRSDLYLAADNAETGGLFAFHLPDGPLRGPWGGRFPADVAVRGGLLYVLTEVSSGQETLVAEDRASGSIRSNSVALGISSTAVVGSWGAAGAWAVVGTTLDELRLQG